MSPLMWVIESAVVYLTGAVITAFLAAKEELRLRQERFAVLEDGDYPHAMKERVGRGITWPIPAPVALAGDAFEKSLRKSHEKNDPTLKARRLEERERKIEHMERELGIGA